MKIFQIKALQKLIFGGCEQNFILIYYLEENLSYQLNMDIMAQTILEEGLGKLTVVDPFFQCNVHDENITYIRQNEFSVPPEAIVITSFYQDIDKALNVVDETNNIKILNIWHGMPIRCINLLDKKERELPVFHRMQKKKRFIHHAVTSNFFKQVFIESFNAVPENVHVVGNLRSNATPIDIGLSAIPSKKVLFAPTNSHGKSYSSIADRLGLGVDTTNESLNEILKANDILLACKPHGRDGWSNENTSPHSNILYLSDEIMQDKKAQTNHLFQHIDLLISDCSSLLIDFLYEKKPIMISKPSNKLLEELDFNIDMKPFWDKSPRSIEEFIQQILTKTRENTVDECSERLATLAGVNHDFEFRTCLKAALPFIKRS